MFRVFFATLMRMDWLLLLPALLLSLLGIATIGALGFSQDPPQFNEVSKQAIALGAGFVAAIFLACTNYRALDHYARGLYLLALGSLLAVLFFGQTFNGTRGWFVIAGVALQPAEFAKLALILILARFMSKHANVRDLRTLGNAIVLAGLMVALVLLQPDFGGAMVLLGIAGILLFIAGVKRSHLAFLAIIFSVVAVFGWTLLLKDYQKERVRIFLDPSRAPLTRGYHINQAKIAIGSGGLFGRGLGFGSQSQLRFLPEAQNDFIFAVIGEELGFAAIAVVLGLFGLFFSRAIRLAKRSRDNFTLFLVVGLATYVFLAVLVNAGMNLGLFPITGIALPFLSAGGSSLLVTWIAVGVLESIAVRSESAPSSTLTESDAGVTIGA